ncbi:MAG: RNA-binding S4 domain-containing protein [Rhodobacteraceae bacterium]|nr:RNA-binding S4 domain-containing protein [Paracoccaceae bacterium]
MEGKIRLDKWLWQARLFKSRSLSADHVAAGHVRLNGQPVAKPAQMVGPGDVLTLPWGGKVRVLHILACGTRRGPAPEAPGLYREVGGASVLSSGPGGE